MPRGAASRYTSYGTSSRGKERGNISDRPGATAQTERSELAHTGGHQCHLSRNDKKKLKHNSRKSRSCKFGLVDIMNNDSKFN